MDLLHSASGKVGVSQAFGVVSVPALCVLLRLTRNQSERFGARQI